VTRSKRLALGFAGALLGLVSTRPDVGAADPPGVVVSEMQPVGNTSSTSYGADWFELTNPGPTAVDISGWKMDDNSNDFASAVALRGVTSIPPGRSVIFIEGAADGSTDATLTSAFSNAWFGSPTPPAGVLIGFYGGSAVGLSTGGDSVNIFDASGSRVTGVRFEGFTISTPLTTLDNSAGAGTTALPLPVVGTRSAAGSNGAFLTPTGAEVGSPGRRVLATPLTDIDLSRYVRVGRFPLPEPTGMTPPPPNLLAQEASAVTYNWDTHTLFIATDGSTSIVQVTKTGELVDSMTLAPGGSPQGTDFYDLEGLAYVGNGQFVMSEERDQQLVLFNYVAGATLTRAHTLTVKIGPTVGNIGIEGVSYDPLTGGFIGVKEIDPQGIFQTTIDFAAGTASNGSATTAPSNMFNPTLLSLLDIADVYALSNLPGLTGPQRENILLLSQEQGVIVNVTRSGQVTSVLTITKPGSTQPVADQGHEGVTMDGDGVLYVVSENGGGDINHPELWVYAPSLVPNQAPTGVTLNNVVSTLIENTSTATRLKVADVAIQDDGLGTNNLTVTGADAAAFDVDASGLYIKAGTVLDFETKANYSVSVDVDDPSVGTSPDASATYTLTLTDVPNEVPPTPISTRITEVTPWASGNTPYGADWFEVTNTGATPADVTGWKVDDDSNAFASAIALTGITVIQPGESVIFIETANLADMKAAFLSAWFGATPPANLQVGAYSGSGIGLSTGGDQVNLFDATGNRITSVSVGTSTAGFTFDNAAGLGSHTPPPPPPPAITTLSVVGSNGAFVAADGTETGSPGRIAGGGVVVPSVIISEITPWGSGSGSSYSADWFEITNIGSTPVDLTGWKMDDDSGTFANAVGLAGLTTLAPGTSAIFMETSTLETTKAAFLAAWFGSTPPVDLLIGRYSGSGVGLGTGGDAVHLFDATGNRVTSVSFGTSTSSVTFDNAAGLGATTTPPPPPPAVTTLSAVGANGAFLAADGIATGSPGRITNPIVLPPLVITEVTPWSSGNANSAYRADWFEVTNIGTGPVDITGFKMDDESASFSSGALLTGISTIGPGESVIFLETADLAHTKSAFLSAWFGSTPPPDLQVGAYSTSGVGLSTDGDAVNLFDASGNRVTGVRVGVSTTRVTFDNAEGLGSPTAPLPLITTLSVNAIHGAFVAPDGAVGSPGRMRDVTPPVIDPVAPIVAEATSAAGASVQYGAPGTIDDVDGVGVAQCAPAPGAVFALGITIVTCTAQDAAGNSSTSTFNVTVRDTTPPLVSVPANITTTAMLPSGIAVNFTASATDIVSGGTAVTCTPASGTVFPVGTTPVTCQSTDAASNTGSATFTVTVAPPPTTPDGRIFGVGQIEHGNTRHHFAFRVVEFGRYDAGQFEYGVTERFKATGRFEATAITSVVFADNPAFRPGRSFFSAPPTVDSVTFAGIGRWNGKMGYTFTVTATDRGQPGRRRDTFTLTVHDSQGRIVASVDDTLDGGNIQSTRLTWFPFLGWF
jgi:uncharacterized protein YjiK